MSRQLRILTGTNQEEVGVELIEQDKKEVVGELEEEDGALTAAVGPTILYFAGENVLIASNLAIWPKNVPTNAGVQIVYSVARTPMTRLSVTPSFALSATRLVIRPANVRTRKSSSASNVAK